MGSAHIEAALSEADTGDFCRKRDGSEVQSVGPAEKREADRWKLENHEAIQELNRIVEERGLFSDGLFDVEQVMERVSNGERDPALTGRCRTRVRL